MEEWDVAPGSVDGSVGVNLGDCPFLAEVGFRGQDADYVSEPDGASESFHGFLPFCLNLCSKYSKIKPSAVMRTVKKYNVNDILHFRVGASWDYLPVWHLDEGPVAHDIVVPDIEA